MNIKHFWRHTLMSSLLVLTVLISSCSFLPDLSLFQETPFYEITYVRPSYEAIRAAADSALQELKSENPSYSKATSFLDEFFREYSTFHTMRALAEIHYSANTLNESYLSEYSFFNSHISLVEKCREELLIASAQSAIADRLETGYYQQSLEKYLTYARYTDPDYLQLSQKEADLITAYQTTLNEAQIDGISIWSSLENAESAEEYNRLLKAFYEQYTPLLAKIYADMVAVRKEMAEKLDYANYLILAGEELGRQLEIEDMKTYLEDLRLALQNVDFTHASLAPIERISDEYEQYSLLSSICSSLDETAGSSIFSDYYLYMRRNALSNISYSVYKENISFTTYLYDYTEPYLFMNTAGTLSDIGTLCHEFGHFVEMGYTYNSAGSIDLAEVYSTSFQLLAISRLSSENCDLTNEEISALFANEKEDAISRLRYQGALSSFEFAIYDPESTVDVTDPDSLCALYADIMNAWGYQIDSQILTSSAGWITIPHIFQYPSYVFSYCISTDIAMQVAVAEYNRAGSGVTYYLSLLDREFDADLLAVVENAELESPFSEGHLQTVIQSFLSCQQEAGSDQKSLASV